ncbi:InlB B-repeat-containing protein [[Eubacterium] hominis]|uniref:InlB B-repeat-containing protein n=1 Tax=[Eubacterium] hominis TaxID=2764325 RepID=UPI003A4E0C35
MLKNLLKKASALVLTVMVSLSLMPITNVFASGNTYTIDDLQDGDIVQTGDIIDKGSTPALGYFTYWKSPDLTGDYKMINYPASPYTIETYFDQDTWIVRKDHVYGNNYDITLIPVQVTSDITLTTDGNGTASSDVSKAKEGDIVTLTATPNTGYKFKEWQSDDVTVTNNQFTMPSKAVSVKAIFEAVTVNHKATIENVEVKGVVGEIFPTRTLKIKITIQNDKLNGTANPFSTLKTNLPKGLGLNMNDYTGTTFTVSVRGIAEMSGKGVLEITIPGEFLESGEDLKVTMNSKATYDFSEIGITAGAGSTHTIGGKNDLTFTCNGSLDNLEGIYVDNTLVDPSNYTVKSGSTIMTLKASYLNTLSLGTHSLKFQYKKDMSAETSFKIVKTDEENTTVDENGTPIKNTGKTTSSHDTTTFALFMSILVLSGVMVINKRKSTN